MYIIGLCGRSGSGKSTVSSFLQSRGVCHIDADEVCRNVYDDNSACKAELGARFGNDIFENGKVNRATLAQRAYGSESGLKDLNGIAHRYISEEIMAELSEYKRAGKLYSLIDAPLLLESGLDDICDAVMAVVSNDEEQISRLKERDGKSYSELKKRLDAQIENKVLIKRADVVVANNGTLKDLRLNTYKAMLSVQLKLGAVVKGGHKRYAVKAM